MKSSTFHVAPSFGVLIVAGLIPMLSSAHHSFASEFDINQPFQIEGVVNSIQWTNPHGWLHVDVEENGATVTYDFELASPNSLIRRGWSRNDLQPGDTVIVSGHRARNRPTVARARGISRANGEAVFGGGVRDESDDE
ncbi:DUF6152 family protein [Candidatus Rariloculus sp.]|uniref:DUF6152 family protein n=1 Tax=Candidatus Rariloculus sp. TaxID=3101265 RepID=UPI003D0AF0BE